MKPMSDYNPGDNISTDSTDNNQTTSDSDGSDSVDTPAASLQATPRPHATTIGVDEPPANGEDEDGDLVDLVDYAGRHPAEDADDLIGFLQDVKRHGIGQTAADDMIGRLFQEFKA